LLSLNHFTVPVSMIVLEKIEILLHEEQRKHQGRRGQRIPRRGTELLMNSNRTLELSRLTLSPTALVRQEIRFIHIVDSRDRLACRSVAHWDSLLALRRNFRCDSNTQIAHQRRCAKNDWNDYPYRWASGVAVERDTYRVRTGMPNPFLEFFPRLDSGSLPS
jgi:hypothetical protein